MSTDEADTDSQFEHPWVPISSENLKRAYVNIHDTAFAVGDNFYVVPDSAEKVLAELRADFASRTRAKELRKTYFKETLKRAEENLPEIAAYGFVIVLFFLLLGLLNQNLVSFIYAFLVLLVIVTAPFVAYVFCFPSILLPYMPLELDRKQIEAVQSPPCASMLLFHGITPDDRDALMRLAGQPLDVQWAGFGKLQKQYSERERQQEEQRALEAAEIAEGLMGAAGSEA